VRLARPRSKVAAKMPAARITWVQREGTVGQRHHGADVLAEISQRESGIRQDGRVVAGHFQCPPREIGTPQAVCRPIFAAIILKQPKTAEPSPGESGSI